nr:MAG TPA: hypothetical protein [Microviridae sp.]
MPNEFYTHILLIGAGILNISKDLCLYNLLMFLKTPFE